MDIVPEIFAWIFPFFFIAMWLGITTLITRFSGWSALQERFPDKDEDPSVSMRMQSGIMGGASMTNCLTIEICPTGLRLKIWKIFGVFAKPIFVPWGMIKPEHESGRLRKSLKLVFGHDQLGYLKVYGSTATNLIERSPIKLD